MMKKHHILYKAGALMISLLCLSSVQMNSQTSMNNGQPNVVLILADDLGFSDVGCYGSEINTPNLDALAASGVLFREFYNVGICAPTRASLLTGQYQHDAGVGYFAINLGSKPYQGYLAENALTIAEVLKENGYRTLMSGKWHVGSDSLHWPNQRGFDNFYGFAGGASSFFAFNQNNMPTTLIRNNQTITAEGEDFYMTDAITDEAIAMIGEGMKTAHQPFFLYLAYNAPHWPLHALPEDIAKYKGKYDAGWDIISEQRHAQLVAKDIISPEHPKAERPSTIPAWETLSKEDKKLWAERMEVHAAMIDRMDQNIGKLITYLKETGQYENTAFFFLSDNGAAGEDVSRTFRSSQANASVSNEIGANFDEQGAVGTAESYYSITHRWAYTANTPFSYWKTFPYEGGISSPFIASYPGNFTENKVVTGRGHLIDILPTILEITQSNYPSEYKGNQILPLAGKSLMPYLTDKAETKRETLFFERGGNKAVRAGQWKLLTLKGKENWKLYDLSKDRGETTDVAQQHPEIVLLLIKAYHDWAEAHQVTNTDSLLQTVPAAKGMQQFEERIDATIPNEIFYDE